MIRNALFKIIAITIGIIFAFGIAEIAVRIFCPRQVSPVRFAFDPQLGEIPTPNQKGRKIMPGAFAHTYSNNSYGFRGSREYDFKKGGKYRILFLGDSFTYGLGVNDEQTFAYLTEKLLLGNGLDVEVINTGNPGKGTDYELRLFQVLGGKFNPDLTVVCFVGNDFFDNERGAYFTVSESGEISPKPLSQGLAKAILNQLPGYNWLVSYSQAANLVRDAVVIYLTRRTRPEARPDGLVIHYPEVKNGYANEKNKKLTEIYLRHLIKSIKNNGGSFMIFYVPVAEEIEHFRKNHQIGADEEAIKTIVAAQGYQLLSLTPVLSTSGEPVDKLYFKVDGHWTALGHALVARYMSENIKKQIEQVKN
jgi:lysophospholipase L1-like esterase